MEISSLIASGKLDPPDAILAFVENSGRFDHIMANIQTLFLGTEVFHLSSIDCGEF
jgi:thiamine pyrophosphokinase